MSGSRFARGSVPPDERNEWIRIAIRARFPKLAAALGDHQFVAMLAAFMAREPQACRSLAATNAALPEFLASTPVYPLWYAELAALDRAHVEVLHAPAAPVLDRTTLTYVSDLKLVPAHALIQITTTADELWFALEAAAAAAKRAHAARPRALDWPRTVLIWRKARTEICARTVEPDEASALRAAARGTSLVELSAGFPHDPGGARALDIVLRWLDDGVLLAR